MRCALVTGVQTCALPISRRSRMMRPLRRSLAAAGTAVFSTCVLAQAAHAAGSAMPWEAPLQAILESIEGPVAKIIAVIIIIITGLTQIGRASCRERVCQYV